MGTLRTRPSCEVVAAERSPAASGLVRAQRMGRRRPPHSAREGRARSTRLLPAWRVAWWPPPDSQQPGEDRPMHSSVGHGASAVTEDDVRTVYASFSA